MIKEAVFRALQQARHTAPRAGIALAAGLAVPLAEGAPGDLDPTFGDAGRLTLDDSGPVWSLELADDGEGFLAGGDYYYSYYDADCCVSSFTQPFSSTGQLDLDYTHPELPGTLILDTARQPDGKVVGIGATKQDLDWTLTAFRVLPDGVLDPTFGEAGIVQVTPGIGTSVVLEPDGRIVVAGSRSAELLVVRLLADGARDEAFGNAGVLIGPVNSAAGRLVRAPGGGYRITTVTSDGSACRVIALATEGSLDQSFGTGGSADVAHDDAESVSCQGIAIQPDGRLLVAGAVTSGSDTSGLLVRLLPDGSPDDTFSASSVSEQMAQATALTLDAMGRVLVAGTGPPDEAGALVARLNADGGLDTNYGNAGTTWIHLPSQQADIAVVNDMAAGADGSLTVAGGHGARTAPFAARLSGDGSANAAGIVTLTHTTVAVTESEAQALVTVRRAGGSAGAVSIVYRTAPLDEAAADAASPGSDYGEVTAQLTWGDGDMTDREIAIPISADDPTPEGFESFLVTIDSLQGGDGLGGRATRVEIAADGAPAGQFIMQRATESVLEGQIVEVRVERAYYGTGEVSVTVAPSGTATAGEDYEIQSTTLTWADGERDAKSVLITTRADDLDEGSFEELLLTLTSPSGGAILGAQASTSVSIVDPPPPASGGGGGGRFGWATLLALCAAGLRRYSRPGRATAVR
jgi:uncharacterized delta-60 repeat protein